MIFKQGIVYYAPEINLFYWTERQIVYCTGGYEMDWKDPVQSGFSFDWFKQMIEKEELEDKDILFYQVSGDDE